MGYPAREVRSCRQTLLLMSLQPVPPYLGEALYSLRLGCTGGGVNGHPLLLFPAENTCFTSSCSDKLTPPSLMALRVGGCLSEGQILAENN